MELRCHRDWRGNFGDDLNEPFFSQVFPQYKVAMPGKTLLGIGTLLNNVHGPIRESVIFGSGYGYGSSIDVDWGTTRVLGVRGPLTAKALGLDPDEHVIGDPAIYVAKMPKMLGGASQAGASAVVAIHHRTAEMWDLRKLATDKWHFLDPGDVSVENYIATIRDAPLVLTESLHGAIIAATFGVPFVPVSIRSPLESTKWADFAESVQIDLGSAYQLWSPEVRLRRRALVSAAARISSGLLRRTVRYGRVLSESERQKLFESLENTRRASKPIVASSRTIASLQQKIERAIEALQKSK